MIMRLLFLNVNPSERAKEINELFSSKYADNDVFQDMRQTLMSSGRSFYQLAMAIAVVASLLTLAVTALKFAKADPREREEAKKRFAFIFFAAFLIFMVSTIVLIVQQISNRAMGI